MMRTLIAVFALCAAATAAAPEVTKLEPPSWWTGSAWNPVRLLVRGHNLTGARLTAPGPIRISNVRVNGTGTYLFADLDLSRARRPGPAQLQVTTLSGQTSISFEVLPPLASKPRGFDSRDVMYLIMPDRFSNGDRGNDDPAASPGLFDRGKARYYHGGDLQGVIDRLPYLKELGITAVWLNPWYENNNRLNEMEKYDGQAITDYHGYGATDFYSVEEHFGDLKKLRELSGKAHSMGIKVIQDQVANHTGPYHPWIQDSPLPDWYHGTRASHADEDWQTWTLMDRGAARSAQRLTLDGWFINILPDLNHENAEVCRYVTQNAIWWVGVAGLDGIRQDTLPYAPREYWAEWRAALAKEFPTLSVVGEVLDGNPALVSFFQGGARRSDGVDSRIESLFDFPLHFAIRRSFARGESIREVGRVIAHDWLYPDAGKLVTLLGLHDVERFMNERGATVDGLKLAYSFLFTSRGIPLVYYGDELGMPGGNDPDNRRDFPGGWPGDPRDAFTPAGRTSSENNVWQHIQLLAKLRKEHEALRNGETILLHQADQSLAYARKSKTSTLVAVFHNGAAGGSVSVESPFPEGVRLKDLLGDSQPSVSGGHITLSMKGRSAALLAAL